jgi:hypothetical protein
VSIFDPTAGNVGVVAQLAAMTKLGKARTKFELFGYEKTNSQVPGVYPGRFRETQGQRPEHLATPDTRSSIRLLTLFVSPSENPT